MDENGWQAMLIHGDAREHRASRLVARSCTASALDDGAGAAHRRATAAGVGEFARHAGDEANDLHRRCAQRLGLGSRVRWLARDAAGGSGADRHARLRRNCGDAPRRGRAQPRQPLHAARRPGAAAGRAAVAPARDVIDGRCGGADAGRRRHHGGVVARRRRRRNRCARRRARGARLGGAGCAHAGQPRWRAQPDCRFRAIFRRGPIRSWPISRSRWRASGPNCSSPPRAGRARCTSAPLPVSPPRSRCWRLGSRAGQCSPRRARRLAPPRSIRCSETASAAASFCRSTSGGALTRDSRHRIAPGSVYALHVGAVEAGGGALASAMVAVGPRGVRVLCRSEDA